MKKDHPLPVLRQIRIASPCPTSWDSMHGDERVRFCSQCRLNVYNLSAMTAAEIEQLIRDSDGRLCGWVHRSADGMIMTRDCPSRLGIIRRRTVSAAARIAASVVIAVTGLALALCGHRPGSTERLERCEPFSSMIRWARQVQPPPPVQHDLGMLVIRNR